MLEGACTATADGCITSPNWPSKYGVNESCTILVETEASLLVQSFQTERNYDVLTVNGVQYSGSGDGLEGRLTRVGDVIHWVSDGVVYHDGWHLCGGGALRRHAVCVCVCVYVPSNDSLCAELSVPTGWILLQTRHLLRLLRLLRLPLLLRLRLGLFLLPHAFSAWSGVIVQ